MGNDVQGMKFEAYAERIMNLREYQRESKKPKKMIQRRFQVKNTEMKLISIKKSQFAGLNHKRYYFSEGITSFLYGHPLLEPLREKKKRFKEIQKRIYENKFDLLKDENAVIQKCKRTCILRSTVSQPFTYFKLDSTKRSLTNKSQLQSTRDYILNGFWI